MTTAVAERVPPAHYLSPAGLAHVVDERWTYPIHLRFAMRKIVETIHKPNGRLMIFMPPRHGKSESVSRFTPAWFLGMYPDKRVILTSYEADFAASWGGKARDILEQYGEDLYGVRVDPSSSAMNRWGLQQRDPSTGLWVPARGAMVTAGARGPITGKGMDLGIIDDPFKNAEEAQSHKIRQKVWEWYQSTFYTRRQKNASIILVMTRWHEDDLAGRLLNAQDEDPKADKWDVLSMPAIAEEDEVWTLDDLEWMRKKGMALWPEEFDEESMQSTRASVGSYYWNAMYQQDPQPADNLGKFKRHWFKYIDPEDWPEFQVKVRYWDTAATSPTDPTEDPDYTVGALMARNSRGTWIEDVVRFQKSPAQVDQEIEAAAGADGHQTLVRIEREPGASGKSMINHYKRLEGLQSYDVRGWPPKGSQTGSKEIRANPLAAEAEGSDDGKDGRLFLKRAPWNKEFVDELVQFPYGMHDDQVDAASGGFAVLTREDGATAIAPQEHRRTSPWRSA